MVFWNFFGRAPRYLNITTRKLFLRTPNENPKHPQQKDYLDRSTISLKFSRSEYLCILEYNSLLVLLDH